MNMINETFGRLTVLYESQKRIHGFKCHWTMCECGNLYIANGDSLRQGKTKSCGCLAKEAAKLRSIANIKHGMRKTRIYNIWVLMRQRCRNPKRKEYKNYGKQGIEICKEWNDFIIFKDWAFANGYRDNLTIDRIDNDGNYETSNCQWITREENAAKPRRRKNKCLQYSRNMV